MLDFAVEAEDSHFVAHDYSSDPAE